MGEGDSSEGEEEETSAPVIKFNALKIITINVSGINDSNKRRQLFMWLRQQKVDVALLSETHLADARSIPIWQMEWNSKGGQQGQCSYWAVGDSPHTGGTAVLIRPGLDATAVVEATSEQAGQGRWTRVVATVQEVEWTWQALYAPAQPLARTAWFDGEGWLPPGAAQNVIMGEDFNCVAEEEKKRKKKMDRYSGPTELCK